MHAGYRASLLDAMSTLRLIRDRDVAAVDEWLTGNGFPTLEEAGLEAIGGEDGA